MYGINEIRNKKECIHAHLTTGGKRATIPVVKPVNSALCGTAGGCRKPIADLPKRPTRIVSLPKTHAHTTGLFL